MTLIRPHSFEILFKKNTHQSTLIHAAFNWPYQNNQNSTIIPFKSNMKLGFNAIVYDHFRFSPDLFMYILFVSLCVCAFLFMFAYLLSLNVSCFASIDRSKKKCTIDFCSRWTFYWPYIVANKNKESNFNRFCITQNTINIE